MEGGVATNAAPSAGLGTVPLLLGTADDGLRAGRYARRARCATALAILGVGLGLGLGLPSQHSGGESSCSPAVSVSLSAVLGWTYFAAWSASFYPQALLNWARRSVVGLSFDFALLNLVGYLCYSTFNVVRVFQLRLVSRLRTNSICST